MFRKFLLLATARRVGETAVHAAKKQTVCL